MALSIPSYLRLSRHNVFYFRWPIPAALHPQGKVQHVETSLRTRNPRLALQMARYLAYHAENITGHLIGMNLSEIKAELQAFFTGKLADFAARREHGGRLPVWMEEQHRHNLKTIEQANSNGMDGRIVFDGEEDIDRYGRMVGRIEIDGLDVNAEMVRQGAAWVYRKYSSTPALYEKEAEARQEGRGLWHLPESQRTPPWEWRKGSMGNAGAFSNPISMKRACCKICSKGKPCGDSCISVSRACHKTAGCAC